MTKEGTGGFFSSLNKTFNFLHFPSLKWKPATARHLTPPTNAVAEAAPRMRIH